MALTLVELKEKLKRFDEVLLLEVLEISSEDIVERFTDVIESKADDLESDLEEETEDEPAT